MTADANDVRTEASDDPLAVFRELKPLLHSLLVIRYRFTEENARDAEADLQVWVERMARRSFQDAAALREALLAAACQYARATQLWRLAGKASGDPGFDRFLARDPKEVAGEIARKAAAAEL